MLLEIIFPIWNTLNTKPCFTLNITNPIWANQCSGNSTPNTKVMWSLGHATSTAHSNRIWKSILKNRATSTLCLFLNAHTHPHNTHTHQHTRSLAHAITLKHTYAHACMHAHTLAHTCAHKLTDARTHRSTRTPTHTAIVTCSISASKTSHFILYSRTQQEPLLSFPLPTPGVLLFIWRTKSMKIWNYLIHYVHENRNKDRQLQIKMVQDKLRL